MTVEVAHGRVLSLRQVLAGCCGIAAVAALLAGDPRSANAFGETRTISLYHVHTKETLTVTYRRHGRYDEDALGKINRLMRDWREQEPIKMDPDLIDLLWEVHHEVGAKEPISIICGYRSPETNAMLRRRSSGVAQHSQHMVGKAIDFFIPGVPLEQVRAAGLRAQRGGVGVYPSSNFVHLDTGSVRHWPRMPEAQLARILEKGPLSASGGTRTAVAQASVGKPSLLARLFGAGKDQEEAADTAAVAAPAKPAARPVAPRSDKPVVASSDPRVDKDKNVPSSQARPAKQETMQLASADSKPVIARAAFFPAVGSKTKPADVAELEVAAQPAAAPSFQLASASSTPIRLAQAPSAAASDVDTAVAGARPSAAEPAAPRGAAPASAARRSAPVAAEPVTTASVAPWPVVGRRPEEAPASALAYAAQPTPIAALRPAPMGTGLPRAGASDTTIIAKRGGDQPVSVSSSTGPSRAKGISVVRVGDRFDDPWMRAMIVSPSALEFMRTSLFGTPDFRAFAMFLQKPATVMALSFGKDPHFGMTTERFAGSAVFFVATAPNGGRTAALR